MSDKLRMDYINSLPQPFLVRFAGDKEWKQPVLEICVETGCMTIDVIGKSQPMHIGDAMEFVDADGVSHDLDSFYSDYEVDKSP